MFLRQTALVELFRRKTSGTPARSLPGGLTRCGDICQTNLHSFPAQGFVTTHDRGLAMDRETGLVPRGRRAHLEWEFLAAQRLFPLALLALLQAAGARQMILPDKLPPMAELPRAPAAWLRRKEGPDP